MKTFFAGAFDTKDKVTKAKAGAFEKPKGVHKKFVDRLYNQLEVDPYSCTVVATYGALSNTFDKTVPYDLMRKTLARMLKDRKFEPRVGASLKDGVKYALEDWNEHFKMKLRSVQILASFASIHSALEKSAVVHGMRYAPAILDDEEDNATLDLPTEKLKGRQGHAMYWCKTNADNEKFPEQAKYVQSYAGKKTRNVIFVQNYKERAPMFFNYAYYFTT